VKEKETKRKKRIPTPQIHYILKLEAYYTEHKTRLLTWRADTNVIDVRIDFLTIAKHFLEISETLSAALFHYNTFQWVMLFSRSCKEMRAFAQAIVVSIIKLKQK